jgi:hypothetical protein
MRQCGSQRAGVSQHISIPAKAAGPLLRNTNGSTSALPPEADIRRFTRAVGQRLDGVRGIACFEAAWCSAFRRSYSYCSLGVRIFRGASLLAGPQTTLVQHRLFRCPKCARTMQLRGDLSTIGHRPNRVALPEKLNPLQLNLLQLLTSLVEFPAGASELRFQPCN